jgi:hypothetical protein
MIDHTLDCPSPCTPLGCDAIRNDVRSSFAAALLVNLLAVSAHASVAARLDTRSLVACADRIVRGRVESRQMRWDEAHARIWTDVTIRVDGTYKGPRTTTLIVRHLGGSIGGVGMRAVGEVDLAQGEEVFLFLRRLVVAGREVHQTVGMAQGKLRIIREGGAARLVGDLRGLMLLGDDGRVRAERPHLEPALADHERAVRALVGREP